MRPPAAATSCAAFVVRLLRAAHFAPTSCGAWRGYFVRRACSPTSCGSLGFFRPCSAVAAPPLPLPPRGQHAFPRGARLGRRGSYVALPFWRGSLPPPFLRAIWELPPPRPPHHHANAPAFHPSRRSIPARLGVPPLLGFLPSPFFLLAYASKKNRVHTLSSAHSFFNLQRLIT